VNEKEYLTHLIRMVRSMYKNTATVIRKDRVNDNTTTEVNKGV
jgi:hypothetical protein